MASTYLTLTNEVLNRMNEVELTSSNFSSARGFQIQCKNAVNDAMLYINQREFGWPFNYSEGTKTLVAGTTRYTIPATAKHVDYDTFRISKDASLSTDGGALRKMDYKEYVDKYIGQEDDATVMGEVPSFIIRTPDNNYALYPYPDAAYELKFEYFINTTVLSAAADVPVIPEQFSTVIVDGATAYAYQYRGEKEQYLLNMDRFENGITYMQSQLLTKDDYVRSYMLTRTRGSSGYIRVS